MQGRIIKIVSNLYTVKSANANYECSLIGKFRHLQITPLVGDFCDFDEQKLQIKKIMNRINYLDRPAIANVDIGLIVTSVKKPDLSLYLLDKILTVVITKKIKPIICFTKVDLMSLKEKLSLLKIKRYYEKIGIPVVYNNDKVKLMKYLKNKVVILTGQTGAGKSTLLNRLNKDLNIKTREISFSLNRGKNTTTHVELYEFNNCLIADSPGFSSINLHDLTKENISNSFLEFKKYTCPYQDCLHIKEKECEVIKAVKNKKILLSRYESYQSFIKEWEKCK